MIECCDCLACSQKNGMFSSLIFPSFMLVSRCLIRDFTVDDFFNVDPLKEFGAIGVLRVSFWEVPIIEECKIRLGKDERSVSSASVLVRDVPSPRF